jgi:hypothetical protein
MQWLQKNDYYDCYTENTDCPIRHYRAGKITNTFTAEIAIWVVSSIARYLGHLRLSPYRMN